VRKILVPTKSRALRWRREGEGQRGLHVEGKTTQTCSTLVPEIGLGPFRRPVISLKDPLPREVPLPDMLS
jgi:hypothetical protein